MTGPTDWSAKSPLIVGTVALFLLVVGFGGWGLLTNIAGAIVTTGQIAVDQSRRVIQHPDGGVVASVEVNEGQRVEKGQTLISLEATQLQSKLNVAEASLFEILARISRLEAERDGATELTIDPLLANNAIQQPNLRALIESQTRLFQTRQTANSQSMEKLTKRKEQIANQAAGFKAQRMALIQQVKLVQEEINAGQAHPDTDRSAASVILPLRREKARLQGLLGELATQAAERDGRITETDLEILRMGTQRVEDAITRLRDLHYRAFKLREDRTNLLNKLSRLDLVAPETGHVYGLTVFARRAVVRRAAPLLFIVPEDRPLTITAQINPLNINEVHLDQDVTLRFTTFDRNTTPEVLGRVSNISSDVFTDQTTGRAYYRVEMVLHDGQAMRLGDVSLVPGMPVDAYIQTGARSPLAYLIKPLTDYFDRAFRET